MDRKKSNAGFSLIEMSFIIIIFGLIVGTIVPLLVSKIQQDKVREARDIVRMVRDEVIGFYIQQNPKRLPDSLINVTGRLDPWNNELFYENATFNCPPDLADGFNLRESDGVNINIINDVAFIILSRGKNMVEDINDVNNDQSIFEVFSYGMEIPGTSRKFDDIYEYVTVNYLCGL